jgi:hypothetical protein
MQESGLSVRSWLAYCATNNQLDSHTFQSVERNKTAKARRIDSLDDTDLSEESVGLSHLSIRRT